MKKIIYVFLLLGIGVLARPVAVRADQDPTQCMRSLETGFFQESLVMTAYSFYYVPQGIWVPLYMTLKEKSLSIDRRLKKKTADMVPNPLEYPVNSQVAWKLIKEALHEVFVESMYDNDVILQQNGYRVTPKMRDDMFNYIFEQQRYKFVDCFGPEKP